MSDYAKGLEGVIANESALSKVEGLEGKLSYLGYDIDDLVEHCNFEEVTYLLHRGKLPNASELAEFEQKLREDREVPQAVIEYLKSLPSDANPMDVLRTGVSMLGIFDPRAAVGEPDHVVNAEVALSIVAKTPVIVAYYHRIRQASTFSSRVTIATLSDLYSAMTSAIGTLKGPLHGGANEGVIKMLKEIGSEDAVDAYVEDCLVNKKKIMGIGHRVYKVLDPRAPHLQKMAVKLTEELGEAKWINMSERIATIMRERKNLNANVDFYSATVYYSLDIPTDLFTPIFAISRMAGWTAQVLEQLQDNRLYRPLTKYVGPASTVPVPAIADR